MLEASFFAAALHGIMGAINYILCKGVENGRYTIFSVSQNAMITLESVMSTSPISQEVREFL